MQAHQTQYRITGLEPPTGCERWSAMRARAELSAAFPAANKAIFHSAESGRIQTPSLLRFRGGRNSIAVVAASDIDDELQGDLVRTLMIYAIDNGGEFNVRNLRCSIKREPGMIRYSSVMVIGRAPKRIKESTHNGKIHKERIKYFTAHNERIHDDKAFREDEFKWAILKGISRQFQLLKEQGKLSISDGNFLGRVEDGQLMRETTGQLMEMIDFVKMEKLSPAKKYLPRYFIEFDMPINLTGDWAAGRMNHKGYGHLIKRNTVGAR